MTKLHVVRDSNDDMDTLVQRLRAACPSGRIVFVSGNFNIIHPGHLRLFNFAKECGDLLVVGISPDGPRNVLLPAELRLESIQSIGVVDHAFILRIPVEEFISRLKPAVVVKGKEYETQYNSELEVVESYGGKLLFSSGEVLFSSLDLLRKELHGAESQLTNKASEYLERHHIKFKDLVSLFQNFGKLRVVVIGDLIIDEYITCDALGMSQEDPTIVLSPINKDRFVGGAGCVATHILGLGAHVDYFCVTGKDEVARYAAETLQSYKLSFEFFEDVTRPTTLKQRFRANNKTLLRVSHLRQHSIDSELADALLQKALIAINSADVLIFSDFNYGCLPQALVERLTEHCIKRGVMMVADSQASSQVSDVSRFRNMRLITPTEHEARLAMRDAHSGLAILAEALRRKANAEHVVVTLGSEGLLIQTPDPVTGVVMTDRLPAFNTFPKDVTGAGDSLLACSTLALASGADIWRSAYVGSVAAGYQVSRIGNRPITTAELLAELEL